MAVSNEQFLFSCIDNSNGGTVNWQNVADECGIVSKAAAAIKYKRMKEKFGSATANGTSSPTKTASGAEGETKAKKTPAKKTPKKRKLNKDDEEEDADKVKVEQDDELS